MHPDHDCDHCGVYHWPWSAQMANAERRDRDLVDREILFAQLEQVLAVSADLDPATVRDVLFELIDRTYNVTQEQGGS